MSKGVRETVKETVRETVREGVREGVRDYREKLRVIGNESKTKSNITTSNR